MNFNFINTVYTNFTGWFLRQQRVVQVMLVFLLLMPTWLRSFFPTAAIELLSDWLMLCAIGGGVLYVAKPFDTLGRTLMAVLMTLIVAAHLVGMLIIFATMIHFGKNPLTTIIH